MCIYIIMYMATMTLSVPDDLYKVIKDHNEVKWSVIARNAMWEYASKVQILDSILEKSELTEMDADEISKLIKKSIREHHENKTGEMA
jgi:predicted  nucleic acid-binding Zn ribbon protein